MMAHTIPTQVPRSESDEVSPPLSLYSLIRTRSERRSICFGAVEQQFPKHTRRESILRKLAGPRENAKRFLRLRSSGVQSPASSQPSLPIHRPRPVSEIVISPSIAQHFRESAGQVPFDPSAMTTDVLSRAVPDRPAGTGLTTPFPPLRNEKIVATGSGLSVGIALTEPVLYLQGYDQHDPSTKKSAILRGQIHLKVTKSVKIKKISICFRGHAQTDWPDGMTPTLGAL